jgi:hypothetical protein
VSRTLDGKNVIGRRVRFPSRRGADSAWYDIVGVVGHLGVNMVNAEKGAAVYLPASPGSITPMWVGIHTNVSPLSLAPGIRADDVRPELAQARAHSASVRGKIERSKRADFAVANKSVIGFDADDRAVEHLNALAATPCISGFVERKLDAKREDTRDFHLPKIEQSLKKARDRLQ